MPKFMFAYHGGSAPQSPEEGAKIMSAWMTWLGGLGDAVVDGGSPVGQSHTVSTDGIAEDGGANPLSGYSIVQAADLAAACKLADGCPILEGGAGTVEVAQIMEM